MGLAEKATVVRKQNNSRNETLLLIAVMIIEL
jgi:hypothetical protein